MSQVISEDKPARTPGRDLVPRLKVIDGKTYVTMASSRAGGMPVSLLWATSMDESPFLFIFDLPGPDGTGSVVVSVDMEAPQAQAVYNMMPRRVPVHELPPECPLDAAPPKPPRKRRQKVEAPSD